MPLPEAIEKARQIYAVEKRVATTPEVIATQLGYTPGTGPANRVMSALKQYRLLEESSGRFKISDLAFNILHLSEEAPERLAAIREAAKSPDIIREILQEFPDGLPSDATLGDFLLKRNFNPGSVSFLIKVVAETISLAKLQADNYEGGTENIASMPQQLPANRTSEPASVTVNRAIRERMEAAGEREFVYCPFGPDRAGRVLIKGDPTQADIDDLIAYLEIAKRRLPPETI